MNVKKTVMALGGGCARTVGSTPKMSTMMIKCRMWELDD